MNTLELTLDGLRHILREAGGVDEGVDLAGDILDVPFSELGYDSLALLETGVRIEREYGVRLDDPTFTGMETPRLLIAVVNGQLVPKAS